MAVELASAFVTIVPTTKGIQAGLERELGPLTGAAAKAGTDSGNALGKSFTGASGGLKSSLGDAEGHFGQFKTKAVGALDSVGISSTMLKVGAGAAIAGFALKAVGDFTDTAKAAIDLSTATGLNVEDASRWLGVADDYKVSATALQTGLGKIAKTLDDTKWAKYGIDTRDAGGQARDVNDILLDSFDALSKVDNATEQARIGQELFGKGYQSLTPILGHTRAEYEKMLGSVEKGQVVTAKEAETAEKMRLAQDQLGDAVKEVSIAFGEQLAKLSPLLVGLAKFIGLVALIPEGLGGNKGWVEFTSTLEDLDYQIKESGRSFDYWQEQFVEGKMSADQITDALHRFDKVAGDSTVSTKGYSYALADVAKTAAEAEAAVRSSTNSTEGYSYAVYDVTQAVELEAKAVDENKRHNQSMVDDVTRGLDRIKAGWESLTGSINADKTWVNLQQGFDALRVKHDETTEAINANTGEQRAKMLEERAAIDDMKLSVIDYANEVLGLPKERVTKMLAEIDAGNLSAVEAQLANLARNRTMTLDIQAKGGSGVFTLKAGAAAEGGYHSGPTWVGEKGAELVDLPSGSYVHTAQESRSMMSHLQPVTSGATAARLNIEHLEVRNDTDADGFFRYANFALAAV